jgi:ribonuclease HI
LLRQIDEAIVGRQYRFEWVRGHVGHPLNEAADVRARGAAEAFQRGRECPAGPGYPGEIISESDLSATLSGDSADRTLPLF